jgi:hypothetical protein
MEGCRAFDSSGLARKTSSADLSRAIMKRLNGIVK